MPPIKRNTSQYTEEELLKMSRREMVADLNDREIAFCEYYIIDHNVKLACIKAGYSADRGIINRLRYKQKVIDYIAWLKIRIMNACFINATDIMNSYAKMAFYDINDYLEIKGNKVKLKDSSQIDGQVVQEITVNNSGSVTVKFPDRLKAFEKLENYMTENPYDWKRKLEERKVELLDERMELERMRAGVDDSLEDDEFVQALEKAANNLFDDIEDNDNDTGAVEED